LVLVTRAVSLPFPIGDLGYNLTQLRMLGSPRRRYDYLVIWKS